MVNVSAVPLVAALCFLLAAFAHVRAWWPAPWFGAAGAALLAGSLAARGLRVGYWPLTGNYEFALGFALGTALAALAVPSLVHRRSPAVEAAAMLLAAALAAYARLLPTYEQAVQPLPPALNSMWLPLHAGACSLAYGALAVAGSAGMVGLLYTPRRDDPDRFAVERLVDRSLAAGYPLLTLSMIFGMIWAHVAWGRYWDWDLKEVWTLVAWLVCTFYWHVRRRPGWGARRLSWVALAALGAALFTFLGTGWLARSVGLASLHLF